MESKIVKYFSASKKQWISVTFLKANGFWRWYFKLTGYGAITLPRRRVVMMEHNWDDTRLIKHECAHVEQYEDLGTIVFLIKYFYLLARHGYEKHPMEIEARKAENS